MNNLSQKVCFLGLPSANLQKLARLLISRLCGIRLLKAYEHKFMLNNGHY
ncbi:hypothetical protein HMPREF1576_00440 [Gardnerella pickettii JCP7719]|uniref:Uncharacterized protein n=1 Tax=Gardnerella pickettii JCP7719 TaxID=1261061 RepID=S4GNS4_9BIFI|nr:hypothetical protein HMPREF1576_00440 [Gardnerella pickettii JCP7719]